jgi:hypothetical protein
MIADTRLALEVAVIQSLAERLSVVLQKRDPLNETVHLGKAEVATFGMFGVLRGLARRTVGMFRSPKNTGRASIGAE